MAAGETGAARQTEVVVVAAGLEVTADGRLEVTEHTLEVAAGTAAPWLRCWSSRNLVKEFPVTAGAVLQRKVASVHAVSDVSFAVRPGPTFGLVGESGCGKTTIGRLIVALEKPTSGSVRMAGRGLSQLHGSRARGTRRDMQLMFQDPYASLDPRMRVGRDPRASRWPSSDMGSQASSSATGQRAARRGRAAAERGRALPARVLRRPAAAHRPGPGADR